MTAQVGLNLPPTDAKPGPDGEQGEVPTSGAAAADGRGGDTSAASVAGHGPATGAAPGPVPGPLSGSGHPADERTGAGPASGARRDAAPGSDSAASEPAGPGDVYERLREALLGQEQQRLQRLETRLDDGALRSRELAGVLPAAVARAGDETMADALRGAVGRCITDSVRGNPGFYADALYPVMGPSIRRAITAAFRNMVQSISQTIDASFSPRSLSWRWTAWRTGIPFHELVLRNTLQFRVEQVFLVQPGSGLLIAHAAREDTETAESDAVSAMLSAIQDFVADSFLQENRGGQKLDSVEFGDYNIWLMHAPACVMAAVVRGFPPEDLREHFESVLERLHGHYGHLLAEFDGDRSRSEPMVPLLMECLLQELRTPPRRGLPPSARIVFAVLTIAILAGSGYWGYLHHQFRERVAGFEAAVRDEPGLVLTSSSSHGGVLRVRGLRDPLAADPDAVAARFGLTEGDSIVSQWDSYQTLEPPIARRRAMALLAAPDSVSATFEGDVLRLSGSAPARWIERASIVALTIPGVASVDMSALVDDSELFVRAVLDALQAPPGVEVAVRGRDVRVSGQAPLDWLPRLAALRDAVPDIGLVDVRSVSLQPGSLDGMRDLLEARPVYFEEGVEVISPLGDLDEIAAALQALAGRLGVIERSLRLRVLGHTDGVGSRASNVALATQRARHVIGLLERRGVPRNWMSADIGTLGESRETANAANRKATFVLGVER